MACSDEGAGAVLAEAVRKTGRLVLASTGMPVDGAGVTARLTITGSVGGGWRGDRDTGGSGDSGEEASGGSPGRAAPGDGTDDVAELPGQGGDVHVSDGWADGRASPGVGGG